MLPTTRTMAGSRLSAIARLFSPALVKELAKNGQSPLFARLAQDSLLLNEIDLQCPIRTFFDYAYSLLKHAEYRNEYVYKAALTHKILLGKHSLQTAVMLNEFRVGLCKADIAILNGTSTVYEIKSERDTLSRLKQQVESYRSVFSTVNIITGKNHLDTIIATTPVEVGVLLLNDRFQISTIRDAIDCKDHLSSKSIFNSIRLNEAKAILNHFGLEIPKVPNTKAHRVLLEIFNELLPTQAHDGFLRILRKSRNLSSISDFVESLPISMQPAMICANIRKSDQPNIIKSMGTPLAEALKWN